LSFSAFHSEPRAVEVRCTQESLDVCLSDGREIVVPLEQFPRLQSARVEDLHDHRLVGGGIGIYWPAINEDIAVAGLVLPKHSD
jgi:hypothetical protein